jgi:hypothetical protein
MLSGSQQHRSSGLPARLSLFALGQRENAAWKAKRVNRKRK